VGAARLRTDLPLAIESGVLMSDGLEPGSGGTYRGDARRINTSSAVMSLRASLLTLAENSDFQRFNVCPTCALLRGIIFIASHEYNVNDGATVNMQFKTGAIGGRVIARIATAVGGPFRITFTEAPTVTDGTSPVAAINTNRTHTGAAQMQIFSNPTSISGGTQIAVDLLPGTGPPSRLGASAIREEGFQLKPSTSYVARVENLSNQAHRIALSLGWREDAVG
jgi:hypothetical protein